MLLTFLKYCLPAILLGAGILTLGLLKLQGKLKAFVILTGSSILGFFVFSVLHNLVYGLFIYWFGADFWDRIGTSDEPVFFIIAVIICPLGLLVGTIGSIILAIKQKKR